MVTNNPVVDLTDLNKDKLIFVGDIHGDFGVVLFYIKNIKDSIQVYCGDIGLGFYKTGYYVKALNKIQEYAKKYNVTIIFVRGNHDNPDYFINNINGFEANSYKNIWLSNEWQLFKTKFGNILCQGGAVSIDKMFREENVSWWNGEKITYVDYSEILNKFTENIDIIVTHTSPTSFPPYFNKAVNAGYVLSEEIKQDCDYERNYLEGFKNYLKEQNKQPKFWFYGHFHNSFVRHDGDITAYGLNINQVKEIV